MIGLEEEEASGTPNFTWRPVGARVDTREEAAEGEPEAAAPGAVSESWGRITIPCAGGLPPRPTVDASDVAADPD